MPNTDPNLIQVFGPQKQSNKSFRGQQRNAHQDANNLQTSASIITPLTPTHMTSGTSSSPIPIIMNQLHKDLVTSLHQVATSTPKDILEHSTEEKLCAAHIQQVLCMMPTTKTVENTETSTTATSSNIITHPVYGKQNISSTKPPRKRKNDKQSSSGNPRTNKIRILVQKWTHKEQIGSTQLPIIGVDSSNTTVHSVQKLIKPTAVLKTCRHIKPRALPKMPPQITLTTLPKTMGVIKPNQLKEKKGEIVSQINPGVTLSHMNPKKTPHPLEMHQNFWTNRNKCMQYLKNHIYPQDQRETTNQKEEWLAILENVQQLIQVKVNLTAKGRAEPKVDVSIFFFFLTLFWVTLGHAELVWVTLGHAEFIWVTLGCTELVWVTPGCAELVWVTLGCAELVWVTLGHAELVWVTLGHAELVWVTLEHAELVWATLGHAELVWVTLGH